MNYDNTNKGVLFTNKKRQTDRHPNLTGRINIDGTEYWLSAWVNYKKSDGEKYLSLAINPMEENSNIGSVREAFNKSLDGDDIPF